MTLPATPLPPTVEVLVVGAGPIGIETAAVLRSEGHDVVVVDAGPIGNTIMRQFPPNTRFFTSPERLTLRNWPIPTTTQEKVTGEEYLAYLRSVVEAQELTVFTHTAVESITGVQGDFSVWVRCRSGITAQIHCRTLVLAVGGTARHRRLGVPGEDLPHVDKDLGDPHRYFGRRVLVVGGRNSAAESALRLFRVGAQVHLAHRHEQLHPRVKHWIRPEVESLLQEGEITGHMPVRVTAIDPAAVHLQPLPGGPEQHLNVDDVLLQIGYEADSTLLHMLGVTLTGDQGGPVFNPETMQTDVPGAYVVGTATAGTQSKFSVFIESSHQHADRVAAALAGRPAPPPVAPRPLPES